jgi:hypothetical protein
MPSLPQETDRAVIVLDDDHAIVLFEFLSEKASTEEAPEISAETVVLNAMLGQLEKQLVAPFREDYADQLSNARNRLASNAGD